MSKPVPTCDNCGAEFPVYAWGYHEVCGACLEVLEGKLVSELQMRHHLADSQLDFVRRQAVYLLEGYTGGKYPHDAVPHWDVGAPGGLILAREDDLDDTPFEWSRDLSRGRGFNHRSRAEHAMKKAPPWWLSKAWAEVVAEATEKAKEVIR